MKQRRNWNCILDMEFIRHIGPVACSWKWENPDGTKLPNKYEVSYAVIGIITYQSFIPVSVIRNSTELTNSDELELLTPTW